MYWSGIVHFMKEEMTPKYKALLEGDLRKLESAKGENSSSFSSEDTCLEAIKAIFQRARDYPDEVR